MRGWGRSIKTDSDRGNSGPTSMMLADMASFIEAELLSTDNIPVFVMGHSMGGQLLAVLASTPEYEHLVSRLAGIILMAPYIHLAKENPVSPMMMFAARWIRVLLPRYQTVLAVPPHVAMRDPSVIQAASEDSNMNATGTLEMYGGMLDRGDDLYSDRLTLLSDSIKAIYVNHGTGDKCTSHHASLRFYNSQTGGIPDRKFKSYEGWCHALHADLPENMQTYVDDTAEWILERA